MFSNKHVWGSFLLAALASAGSAQAAPAYAYRATALVPFTPGQGSGIATMINNRGLVCGQLASNNGFCSYRGTVTQLHALAGDSWGLPGGLNELNQVVGYSYGPDTPGSAVIFVAGQARRLAVASQPGSSATDINNLGQIVGGLSDGVGNKAFVSWHGTVRELGTLGGPRPIGAASGINDLGQIVGSVSAPNSSPEAADLIGFLYQHGVMRALPTPAGYASAAVRINVLGHVVGSIEAMGAGFETRRATLWKNGVLQTLLDEPSDARGINNLGQVVGGTYEREGGFLYTPGLGVRNLNALIDPAPGYRLIYPQDINDLGQIVGFGCKADLCGPMRLDPVFLPTAVAGGADDPGLMRSGEQ